MNEPSVLFLKAPLSGSLLPIEQVPDPVFSQKMVGDGISIDPLDQTLVAPCDGEVTQLHSAGHALTITSAQGVEVMMHIGLDTVHLKGEGFTPTVSQGDQVRTGDPLITFDADFIATHAKSLLTQIIITNGDRVAAFVPANGMVRAGLDTVLELYLHEDIEPVAMETGRSHASEAIIIPNRSGLHARPAAVLANLAKKFTSDIRLQRGEEQANAKSVVSIMNLEVAHQDKVTLVAKGPDAQAALDALTPQLRSGLGDKDGAPAPAPASTVIAEDAMPAPRMRSDNPDILLGVAASPGIGVGTIFQLRRSDIAVEELADDPLREQQQLAAALEQAKVQLDALQARLHQETDPAQAAIFAAHQELLSDPDLLDIAHSSIAKGKSAAFAWKHAYTLLADRMAGLKNELLAGRAVDLRDAGRRVLLLLCGTAPPAPPDIPRGSILIAEELTPSDTANLSERRVQGLCTITGGATSHVAILARSLDIPAVAGIEARALDLPSGTSAVVDGSQGTLRINPDQDEVAAILNKKAQQETRKATERAAALEPAVTIDGHRVEVAANIGGLKEARNSIPLGGEGVGLLRSEFLYLDRPTPPNEEEQTAMYREIAEALGPNRPLIIRTLDVGGDKPLPYLPLPTEENPFLGQRGIRVSLARPELLRVQLRAILRANVSGTIKVMFPMIATMQEIRDAKVILQEEQQRLSCPAIETGIMIEVPSAALMASRFAPEVDFFSIGTNDLTQYTLAMDRGHPKLAPMIDSLTPAVLQLINYTVRGAHKQGKWVGVCGGMASDPQAVPILIGLGVNELSVTVPAIPAIKALVRRSSYIRCKMLAEKALACSSAAEVRALAEEEYQEK